MTTGKECCGTCKYHLPVDEDEWVCGCRDSENCWDYTGFDDSCSCYEKKKRRSK